MTLCSSSISSDHICLSLSLSLSLSLGLFLCDLPGTWCLRLSPQTSTFIFELGIPKSLFLVQSPLELFSYLRACTMLGLYHTVLCWIESYPKLFNSYCSSNYTARHSKAFWILPHRQWVSDAPVELIQHYQEKNKKEPSLPRRAMTLFSSDKGTRDETLPLNHCLEGVEETFVPPVNTCFSITTEWSTLCTTK